MRGEVESMGKSHQAIAAQMKSELEEPLAAFSGGMKERRKIVQNGIEKLFKLKVQQTQAVNKVGWSSSWICSDADQEAVTRQIRARLLEDQRVSGPRTHGHGPGRAKE